MMRKHNNFDDCFLSQMAIGQLGQRTRLAPPRVAEAVFSSGVDIVNSQPEVEHRTAQFLDDPRRKALSATSYHATDQQVRSKHLLSSFPLPCE